MDLYLRGLFLVVPDGQAFFPPTADQLDRYLSERARAMEGLGNLDQYSWDRDLQRAMENSYRNRIADLDRSLLL